MIHLITISGKSARLFHLEQRSISNFKALLRTICSGRVLLVSSRFRSDLFYSSQHPRNKEVLTLWAMYANTIPANLHANDLTTSVGIDDALTWYFQSINTLATNWFNYRIYREAFKKTYVNDRNNPIVQTVIECDHFLVKHPSIVRPALIIKPEKIKPTLNKDTFSLAMNIIQCDSHSN